MTTIVGSSSITIRGFTGPSGPEGPTGPTGNAGVNATGCGGATGSKGTWLDSLQWDMGKGPNSDFVNTFQGTGGWGNTWGIYATAAAGQYQENLTWEGFFDIVPGIPTSKNIFPLIALDNNQNEFKSYSGSLFHSSKIIGKFYGNKYSDSSGVIGATTGKLSLFTGISGGTFVFRSFGISGSGLTVGSDSNYIYIDTTQISAGSSGFGQNELLYWTSHSQINGITLNNGFTLGYVSQPSGTTKDAYFSLNSRTLSKSKIKTIAVSNPQGITLDLTEAGVFYIHTPAKITGFTGTTGWHPGTVYSTTLILENDYVFQFPKNIVFPKNNNTLSCGENIINLTSIDAGKTWLANIFGKGFRSITSTCHSSWDKGSCTVGTTCENYVTRWECNNQGGTFCLAPCAQETDVYEEGSCCVNGVCRDGVSQFKCNIYGGRFWSQQQTGGSGCDAFKCWDPCFPTIGSCCIGLTCMDRHTKSECDLLGGEWKPWSCSTPFACEPLINSKGACCLSKTQCQFMSWKNCTLQGGLFMGIGELCDDVNCDCFEGPGVTGGFGCNSAGIDFAGAESVFKEYKIDLTDLDFTAAEQICLTYKTYTIKDRIIITKTNDSNPAIKSILQGPVATNYTTSQYPEFAQQTVKHPAYHDTDADGISIPSSIIYDSGCVCTDILCTGTVGLPNGIVSKTITINPGNIELDINNEWYKQLRLWILGGCDGFDGTRWDISIKCNACEYGACCYQDTCVERTSKECTDTGGVWKGQGSSCGFDTCCTDASCPPPSGPPPSGPPPSGPPPSGPPPSGPPPSGPPPSGPPPSGPPPSGPPPSGPPPSGPWCEGQPGISPPYCMCDVCMCAPCCGEDCRFSAGAGCVATQMVCGLAEGCKLLGVCCEMQYCTKVECNPPNSCPMPPLPSTQSPPQKSKYAIQEFYQINIGNITFEVYI